MMLNFPADASAIQAQIDAVASWNGKAFLGQPDTLTPETIAALRSLAEAIGLPNEHAKLARPHELVSIYATARKGTTGAIGVAERVQRAICKRAILPIPASPGNAPTDAARPLPAPSSPPVEVDYDAIREMIDAGIKAGIAEAKLPRKVVIEIPELPPVEVSNAHPVLPRVLAWLALKKNVYIYGPAGSGKTTMAEHCADALSLTFYSASSVMFVTDIIGFISPITSQYVRTAFRECFEHGGLFLLDEVDNSDASALVAFNMALAQSYFVFPDGIVQKHPNFRCIAAANTVGNGPNAQYVGRTQLDGAFLDRFRRLRMDYDEATELAIAPCEAWTRHVQAIRAIAQKEGIKAIISPRASIDGGAGILAGMAWEDVEEDCIFCGMPETEINRIKAQLGR